MKLLIKSGAEFTFNHADLFKEVFRGASGRNDYNFPSHLHSSSMIEFINNIFDRTTDHTQEDLDLFFALQRNTFGKAKVAAMRASVRILSSKKGFNIPEVRPVRFDEFWNMFWLLAVRLF